MVYSAISRPDKTILVRIKRTHFHDSHFQNSFLYRPIWDIEYGFGILRHLVNGLTVGGCLF